MTSVEQASFKEQYNQIFKFDSIGGTMRLCKILQLNQSKCHTIVLVPGWCESLSMMRTIVVSLAERGYNVIALDYQHLDNRNSMRGKLDDIPVSIPENEYVKALALVSFLKEGNWQDVSIVAHSEGSIIGTLAVDAEPKLFKNLILVNPAGFIKEGSFLGLSTKFIYSIYKQELRNFGQHLKLQLRYTFELLKVMFSNPIQSFQDGFAMSNHTITGKVSDVCGRGIQVDCIFNADDVLFPLAALQEAADSILCDKTLHIVPGGHNELFIRTDEFVTLVDKIVR